MYQVVTQLQFQISDICFGVVKSFFWAGFSPYVSDNRHNSPLISSPALPLVAPASLWLAHSVFPLLVARQPSLGTITPFVFSP
jgi:hypothetical protein